MGTLSDITTQATVNYKRYSTSYTGYQALHSPTDMEKENLIKAKSPHFMTPTFSSSKQSATTSAKSGDKNSTSSSTKPLKMGGDAQWMKAAAKRVGFRRNGDGTPRSKKETKSKGSSAISFPDKVLFTFSDLQAHIFVLIVEIVCYTVTKHGLKPS